LSRQADYWDTVVGVWQETRPQTLWREHSDAVNSALLARWLPNDPVERLLKTDLFDEACSEGLYSLLASRARTVVGMDVSVLMMQAARLRHSALPATQADARCLPFADGTFDVIVSNSTLDHFESLDEVVVSLQELRRVLRKNGQLLLTLDNLANPAIALRNALPAWLLDRLPRVVPYYVGVTCGPGRLRCMVAQAGFEVLEVSAIMHHPSVLAVATARMLQRHAGPEAQKRFLVLLLALERLSRLPTRFLTGHYSAVRATKR
jgi:ubiquinone/menaquinone biosynthesis C-methylase UbiE